MKISLSVLFVVFTISLRAQWTTSYAPHFRNVNAAVIMNDRKAIMLVGGNLSNDSIRSVFTSTDIGNTWGVPLDIPGKSWLKCVAKVSSSKFIAAGYTGNIMKSVDDGNTWSTIANLPFTGSNLRLYNSVFFVDSTTGYIAGGLVDSLQTILKTTDGGNSWVVQRDTLGYWLSSIFFANNALGWAVGENGTFLKTVNGGVNWQLEILPGDMGNRALNAVFFTTPERGIIVGGIKDSLQTILQTVDGGNTWQFTIDSNGEMLNAIDFVDTLSGYIAGDNCTALFSSDGGMSWEQADVPSAYIEEFDLRAVNFYDRNFGVFAGESGKYLIYNAAPSGVVDIKESNNEDELFCVAYPNPAQSLLNIEYFNQSENENIISLTDMQGKVVAIFRSPSEHGLVKKQLDISAIANGSYVLNVYNGSVAMKRKFVVVR